MKQAPKTKLSTNFLYSRRALKKITAITLAVVVIGGVSYLGVHNKPASHAASATATIALMPSTNTYHIGDTIPVLVQVNSVAGISTVEADFSYPAAQLKYLGVTEGTTFTVQDRTATATAGNIDIIRAVAGGSAGATGANTVITVNFQVIAAGTAALTLDKGSGVYDIAAGNDIFTTTGSLGSSYNLQLPAPTITGIAPTSGLTTGANTVTITGTNFVSGATVNFGTTAATNVTVASSTSMTATVPSHAAGTVSVVETNPDGQASTLSNGYAYNNPGPTVTSISPATGLSTGGTAVTITGTGFASSPTVKIGGAAASNVVFVSSTSITATTPAHAAGMADVVVTNADAQTATKVGGFTYTNPAPAITSVSPTGGSTGGGTVVTISGTNFISGATVTFGGVAATGVSVTNGNTVTATTPAGATGAADVKVTNPDGQSVTKTGGYAYATAGDINGDGHINTLDLSIILTHDGTNYAPADLNHDGTVGAADLAILLAHWTW